MRKLFANHICTTAQKRGWDAIANGELVTLAEKEFDLFITCDQNIRYQQNLTNRRIAILELTSNDLRRILADGDVIRLAVGSNQPGDYVHLEVV